MVAATQRELDTDRAMGFGAPMSPIDISVILPAYNESESIDGIYAQMVSVLEPLDIAFEILFVDDGSTDDTWELIEKLAEKDHRVRAIHHRRNYGKAMALGNGFTYARGDIMVTSDADMQYDPYDVVRLIEKAREGYDVVSAYKVVRRDPLERRLPSKFFNWFVRKMTGIQLHDMNAGLKAFRYDAARDIVPYAYGELHRFFIVIAARLGYRVTEVPVESLPRPNGTSKYGFERYLRGAFDFITIFFLSGYRERPLHFLGSIGLTLGGLGTAIIAYLAVLWGFTGASLSGRPSLTIAALLIMSGLQLAVFGLMAEMINNMGRGEVGRTRISRVLGVDRRTSVLIQGPVQVDRRKTPRAEVPVPDLSSEVVVDRRKARRD